MAEKLACAIDKLRTFDTPVADFQCEVVNCKVVAFLGISLVRINTIRSRQMREIRTISTNEELCLKEEELRKLKNNK